MGLQLHPESNVTQNLHPFSPCIGHKIARYSSAKDPARAVLEAQATRARGRAYEVHCTMFVTRAGSGRRSPRACIWVTDTRLHACRQVRALHNASRSGLLHVARIWGPRYQTAILHAWSMQARVRVNPGLKGPSTTRRD